MLSFLHRIATNKNKDLFLVKLGVALLLGRVGIVGGWARFISPFLCGFLGLLIEDGTFVIDLALDSYREGQKLKEFEKAAKEAYEKATAKVYDYEQKKAIRKQYLEIISRIGTVGNGPK